MTARDALAQAVAAPPGGSFAKIIVTPNILTEVSNLAGQLGEPARSELLAFLATDVGKMDERYVDSRDVVTVSACSRLGLTDAGIAVIVGKTLPVITDDLDLYIHLSDVGVDVVNFSHLRPLAWR